MVAGQNQHIIRIVAVDEVQVLINGVGGAFIPVRTVLCLIGRKHHHSPGGPVQVPGLTVADVFVQHQRLVLRQNTYGIDARIHAVGQGKIDDPVFSAEGDGRFGGCFG